MKMEQDVTLLPLVKVDGATFLVDIANREFRDFGDSKNVIKMHSAYGKKIVSQMHGQQWNCMGISTGCHAIQ